jgi:hypothetical protein
MNAVASVRLAGVLVGFVGWLASASATEWTKVATSASTDSYLRIEQPKAPGVVPYEILLDLRGGSLPARSVVHRFVFLCSPINRVRFLGSDSFSGQLGAGRRIGGMRPEDLGDANQPRELQDHEVTVRRFCQ